MTHFHCGIRKHGVSVFRWTILEEGWDPKIGKEIREPYWISVLKPEYNMTQGGDGTLGFKYSEEQNKNNSVRQRGKQYTLGSKRSEEWKVAHADIMRGNSNALGNKWTEEQRKDQSDRMRRYYLAQLRHSS